MGVDGCVTNAAFVLLHFVFDSCDTPQLVSTCLPFQVFGRFLGGGWPDRLEELTRHSLGRLGFPRWGPQKEAGRNP